MKKIFITLLLLFSLIYTKAQDSTYIHFDIKVSAIFWTPTSTHLLGTYRIGSFNKVDGFREAVIPAVELSYFFKNNIGISVGYNYLQLEKVEGEYKNAAYINNLRLGISGRLYEKSRFGFTFSTGLNYIASYDMMMDHGDPRLDPSNLRATGTSIGVYFNTGINIKIFKGLYFATQFDYTYIPTELTYTYSDDILDLTQTEQSNLGGLGLQMGLGFQF